jgi:hypothetical protein
MQIITGNKKLADKRGKWRSTQIYGTTFAISSPGMAVLSWGQVFGWKSVWNPRPQDSRALDLKFVIP